MHERDPDGYRRVNRAHLLLNVIVVLIPVVAIACLSVPIMSSYGASFRSGWPVLVVFCVATIPEALNTILSYPLIARGKMWFRCGFDIALSAILLLLGMWLIPRHGAIGFAIAYLAAFSTISAALYIVTRVREVDLGVERMAAL
jgi:O-antigen/teichoic acid export membrane protein